MRYFPMTLIAMCVSLSVHAAEPGLATRVVKATYRLRGEGSMATCFVVSRPDPQAPDKQQLILITAAHVLQKMKGNTATLVSRRWNEQSNQYERLESELQIRIDKHTPQWTEHQEHDAGAMLLPLLVQNAIIESLPLDLLATQKDFESIEPGQLVRCVGYPHAAHFDPSPPGFALVRLGCIASYPLVPLSKNPTFLVDFNTFEGDSGGLIYMPLPRADGSSKLKILGVIHGQHMLNEKYDLIYQTGETRKRLGVSIVLNAQVIRETIELLSQKAPAD